MIVTFFGHADTPPEAATQFTQILIDLIENKGATLFYVGNNGEFDQMVQRTLTALQRRYLHIRFYIVLAYFPGKRTFAEEVPNTIYPEGLERVPKRFAICRRNEWMITQSDLIVAYVNRSFGGAARYVSIAEKRGKLIINIAN